MTLRSICIFIVLLFLSAWIWSDLGMQESQEDSNLSEGILADVQDSFRLIFIYTSESCECTLEQCRKAGEALKDLVDSLTIPLLIDSVDVIEDWNEAGDMMKTYGKYFVPVLVLLDHHSEVLFSLDGFFRPDTIGILIDQALH